MKARAPTPPLLAALSLWGWQAELLPWAVAMGLLFAAARFFRWRLDLRQEDFNRLWNFTTLLFLAVALYLFLARQGLETVGSLVNVASLARQMEGVRQVSQTAIAFLRWLPFILFPFMLVHAWSRTATLPWATFSLFQQSRTARTLPAEAPEWVGRRVNPAYLYLVLVLFASCTATLHSQTYLPLLLAVAAWALWPWRNRRFRAPVWASLFLGLLGVSLLAQYGLLAMREALQALENRWMDGAGEGNFGQLRNFTAMGAVGRLKQSGRIVLRIQTRDGEPPGLLREAAFNRFRANAWSSVHKEFQPVPPEGEGGVWRLSSARRGARFMTVSRYTASGDAPLALADNAVLIRDLPAVSIETNYLASARLRGGPPLAIYSVEHGTNGGFDGLPELDDTRLDTLSEAEREVIQEVARKLELGRLAPAAAIESVRRFFAAEFQYSLWQRRRPGATNTSALAWFLRESRAGHCEYFAAATVLLLREAGVPTRYAVGYSPEQRRGPEWLARARDAHAWCLAHVDGRWQNVDTTPGNWREREAAAAGWWEIFGDWFSQAWYRFALWRQQGGNWRIIVFALSLLVLSWMAWRQLRGSRWRRARKPAATQKPGLPPPGLDSEFFAVARRFELLHSPRPAHETLRAWIQRLGLTSAALSDPLGEALRLHYRLRFDPAGLTEADRHRLRQLSVALLREAEAKRSP